jgi:hypothetical protein
MFLREIAENSKDYSDDDFRDGGVKTKCFHQHLKHGVIQQNIGYHYRAITEQLDTSL